METTRLKNIWNGLESDHPTHAALRDHFQPKSQNKKREPPPKDSALAAAIGILSRYNPPPLHLSSVVIQLTESRKRLSTKGPHTWPWMAWSSKSDILLSNRGRTGFESIGRMISPNNRPYARQTPSLSHPSFLTRSLGVSGSFCPTKKPDTNHASTRSSFLLNNTMPLNDRCENLAWCSKGSLTACHMPLTCIDITHTSWFEISPISVPLDPAVAYWPIIWLYLLIQRMSLHTRRSYASLNPDAHYASAFAVPHRMPDSHTALILRRYDEQMTEKR